MLFRYVSLLSWDFVLDTGRKFDTSALLLLLFFPLLLRVQMRNVPFCPESKLCIRVTCTLRNSHRLSVFDDCIFTLIVTLTACADVIALLGYSCLIIIFTSAFIV